jgi:hypothetical protein
MTQEMQLVDVFLRRSGFWANEGSMMKKFDRWDWSRWFDRRRLNAERYRNHLIFVRTDRELETQLWRVSAHVQFNEGPLTFRDVWLPRPTVLFKTKKGAATHMIKEAKRWIDDRLHQKKPNSPSKPFRIERPTD